MLYDLVEKCRSYRSFAPGVRISREMLIGWIGTARIASATMNRQPLKYRMVYTPEECARVLPLTRWASALDIKLPPKGHEPTAYIVICHDTDVIPFNPIFLKDVGICAELIMLSATEQGYGGCIIGSANAEALQKTLGLPDHLQPQLVLALGKPDETVVLTEAENGEVTYYRDENGVHYTPKRPMWDILIG